MDNIFLKSAAQASAKGIGNDIYIAAKNWFKRLDPANDKLEQYRDGINSSLNHIQIMGMQCPKELHHLYIALRTLPTRRNLQGVDSKNLFKPTKNNALAQKFIAVRNQKGIDKIIKSIGYEDILVDELDDDNELAEKDISLSQEYSHKIDKLADSDSNIDSTKHGLSALEIIRDNDNAVILGQPGSGKTTFLKYLALAYTGFVPVLHRTDPLLPVFVPLRELKRVEAPTPTADWLLTFVFSCASETGGNNFNIEWLKLYLRNKECLILLDGIDEIDPELVGTVMQSLLAFSRKYRGNKIVTTCRSAVFDYVAEGFIVCEIDNFNNSDIAIFIDQWFDSDVKKKNDLLSHIKESKAARDLCKTPLLLTMICILYEYNQTIPHNRSELYQTCVEALFFRWDTFRYIDRASLTEGLSTSRKKMILARIARKTFDKDVYYYKESTLVEMLKTELERSNLNHISSELLLKELESHNGLFIERGGNVYSFSHLTFQEFFTALAYHEDNAHQDLLNIVLYEPRYREVFLMALEKMYEPDNICLQVAAHIKENIINENETNEYLQYLVSGILSSDIPLDPKIKIVLNAVRGDLYISDVKHTE